MMKHVRKTSNDNYAKYQMLSVILGRDSPDIILDSVVVDDDTVVLTEEDIKKVKIIRKIVDEYLVETDRVIFQLIIEFGKSTAEVMKIMGFNNWWTSENNIVKVMNMIKLYYDYEKLDHKLLDVEIKKILTKEELVILGLMHSLKKLIQIKNETKSYYEKTQKTVKRIMETLKTAESEEVRKYHDFLKEIRRYRGFKSD